MIRSSNRLFWLIIGVIVVALAVLIVRPLRQAFGSLVWDSVLVPLYANSKLLVDQRILLCGAVLLILMVLPFLFAPIWEALGLLDNAAMALARRYYSSRLVRYTDGTRIRDPYARLRGGMRRVGYALRFMRHVPILSDLYQLIFDDMPSARAALLLLNRIHESNYVIALDKDPAKNSQRWQVAETSALALIHHTLAGSHLSVNARLIGALLLDDLHSQGYLAAARLGADLPSRLPDWRIRALRLYRSISADLPSGDPWVVWVALRVLWLELFTASEPHPPTPSPQAERGSFPNDPSDPSEANLLDGAALSIVEAQFWRLTEHTDTETSLGIAIAAAHRLAADLGALTALGNSPGASDLLRFGTDLGHWIDSTADTLRATVWHQSPSSRASELPPGTFLAAQLIRGIGPKWAQPGEPASDAIRGQMIAARGAIYALVQSGWRGMVPDLSLSQAETLAGRAADEIAVEDSFGGRA